MTKIDEKKERGWRFADIGATCTDSPQRHTSAHTFNRDKGEVVDILELTEVNLNGLEVIDKRGEFLDKVGPKNVG